MPRSIQLDQEAWTLLQQVRQGDESWSDLIRRCVRPKPSLAQVLAKLREFAPSEQMLDAADNSVKHRRKQSSNTASRKRKP